LAGIGSKFKRDKKDEVVAVVKEEVFETVSQEPVAVASAEKKGGMFGMFSSDKKDEPEIESVEPDQSKSFGGLFSRKPKEESATNIDLTTEVESEESSSLFKGLLGGKKDKEQPEIETLEVESEKKLRIPNPFKGKKDKETAGSAEL